MTQCLRFHSKLRRHRYYSRSPRAANEHEQEQGFKYPERAFRLSEQMFRYQIPGARHQQPGSSHQIPGTRYLVPVTWCQVPGSWNLVSAAWNQVQTRTPNSPRYNVLGLQLLGIPSVRSKPFAVLMVAKGQTWHLFTTFRNLHARVQTPQIEAQTH